MNPLKLNLTEKFARRYTRLTRIIRTAALVTTKHQKREDPNAYQ